MKKIFSQRKRILFVCMSILLMVVTVLICNDNLHFTSETSVKQESRTVSYENKKIIDDSLFENFDEYSFIDKGNSFDVIARKNFDLSVLEEVNLVGFAGESDSITLSYEVNYIDDENTILLSITALGTENDIPVVDLIPGLISLNDAGEDDVMFAYEGEYLWLSDLLNEGLVNDTSWFSWLRDKAKEALVTAAQGIALFIINGLKLVENVKKLNLPAVCANFGAMFLNMWEEVDSKNRGTGVYHANFNCWQQYFGYTDFYDKVFKAFTCMDRKKFEYVLNGEEYILWAWKGDYLNLGAGAELGVYKRWSYDSNFWTVDKSQAMPMTLRLAKKNSNSSSFYDILNYKPTKNQWWITGFNYNYHVTQSDIDADRLKAYYTVTFNNSTAANAFAKSNSVDEDGVWDRQGNTFSFNF